MKNTINYGSSFFFKFVYYSKKRFIVLSFLNSNLIVYKVPEKFTYTYLLTTSLSCTSCSCFVFLYIALNSSVYSRYGLIVECNYFSLTRRANVTTIENFLCKVINASLLSVLHTSSFASIKLKILYKFLRDVSLITL